MKTQNLILALVVLFVFSFNELFSQVITGTVTEQGSRQPIIGASVLIKGTNTGIITDFNGKYSIEIDSLHKVLVFSFIGFETKEVNAKGRTIIDVSLVLDNAAIDEVVVVGYAVQRKSHLTGSVSTVRSNQKFSRRSKESKQMAHGTMMYNSCPPQDHNTEGYSTVHENGFKKVSLSPLSTFSIDVDAASYSNMRRYINNGSLPPVDAVRIEEMINYFSYDYPQPENDIPFSINTELAECPWNTKNYLLHVGLQGKKMDMSELPASNIVFLLDVSGSMSAHNKLPLLKSSLALLVENLRPIDKVAIVVYAGSSGVVLPSTSANNKQAIMESLNRLNAGGSTAGGAGLKLAYKIANENFLEEGNNRIILATDGDFNVGQSSNAEMERLIEQEREKGIAISVLGFGMGNYKDDKMEIIADKGNGNYAYIDNLQEAKKVLVNEFGGTLFTIAKDVKFQLEFNPAEVAEYRLIGYENRLLNDEDFEDDKKDAGEMGAGHTVTALYEVVPVNDKKATGGLKYQTTQLTEDAKVGNELITLKLRYKEPDGHNSKLVEQIVKNDPLKINATSNDFMFSASIAQFGMLLRKSEFKGNATWKNTKEMALGAKGSDEQGYRGEMIRLIESAGLLKAVSLR